MKLATMQPARWDHCDLTGWFVSPKVDGIRARWDGSRFLTRGGKTIDAPSHLAATLPADVVLDGELSAGNLSSTVEALATCGDKTALQFWPFDAPEIEGCFSKRLHHLPWHTQALCESEDHFGDMVEAALAEGFEGVVAHHPDNLYSAGISRRLVKHKPFQDAEAVCIGVTATGRPSLVCDWNGVQIKIPNLPADVAGNPPIGKLVTFEFQEIADSGKPRHPVFVAVRDYE